MSDLRKRAFQYAYDFANRRISSVEGTRTTYFHYDGASANVIAETDGAGTTVASYTYDSAGGLHSMTRGGATYYYHVNAHGDVVALTDAGGDIVNSYRYDPWGEVLQASETVPNPYRYASYRFDTTTGLYYLWNRYYAAGLARFLTKDTYPGVTESPATQNPYAYCGSDPVNAIDPSGRSTNVIQDCATAWGNVVSWARKQLLNLGLRKAGEAAGLGPAAGSATGLAGRAIGAGGTMADIAKKGMPLEDQATRARKATEKRCMPGNGRSDDENISDLIDTLTNDPNANGQNYKNAARDLTGIGIKGLAGVPTNGVPPK